MVQLSQYSPPMNQRIDRYDPQSIEPKWQRYWYDEHPELFQAREGSVDPKYYVLIEFPYPSGEGLHVGHPRSFTAMDIIARKRRAQGYNVLYPIGFDAFGLPAENYALKTGIHPRLTTERNIANFTRQLKSLGYSFDWSRAVDTTKPEYYKWTQWIFAQLFKHGLAYKTTTQINYCTHDKVALANEEVIDGKCERCGHEVIKKEKDQWLLRITDYADRLDRDLDVVNFLERIKTQQRNWIGRSEGAEISFKLNVSGQEPGQHGVTVFTTRPDTIYGVTFLAISPELAQKWIDIGWQASDEVKRYISAELGTRDESEPDNNKEKTGIATGVMAVNPLSGEEVPVWVVNYVLGTVGTGAIMGVPAHDERDYEFAQKYHLPIKRVIEPLFIKQSGSDAVRPGLPLVERDAVVAVVKHWSDDKFLCLNWKANDWQGFVVGGIEAGESIADAAVREVKEETGYQSINFVREFGPVIHSQFYHEVKQQNRFAHFRLAYVELTDSQQTDIAAAEQALHEVVWVDRDEVAAHVSHDEDMAHAWRVWDQQDPAYCGDGLVCDSGDLSGLVFKKSATAIYRSYLMGAEQITDADLKALGVVIHEMRDNGDRLIEIPRASLAAYEQLVSDKLTPGYWMEYVGDETVFIFKEKDGTVRRLVLSPTTEQEINELSARLSGEAVGDKPVREWLAENSWYRDVAVPNATEAIVARLEKMQVGRRATTYKLRDWVFSRQRYWGEPIPLVHCDTCAARKQKVLLIHGFEGSGETNWLPWLKSELERRGFEVFAPTMSTSAHPSVESWIDELLPYVQQLDADDIVVGHSLGAQAAMHLIKQSNTKIGHLFLVGEVPLNPTPAQWRLVEERWDDARSDLAALKEFVEVKVDYQAVNELVSAATIMVSRDDFIIGPEVEALRSLAPAGWHYLVYEDRGHFTATTAPELLELVERTRVSGWRLVSDLPVVLPEVEEFRPGENGESPLANLDQWVNTICPHCGGPARRETDTMPQWAGSSWYFLRYIDPDNDQVLSDPGRLKYWLSKSDATNDNGIDWYNGGMEHTTLHLLYSRFWHKFLYDIGVVPTLEPYAKRTSQGMILGEGGEKMSKSRGNVVNPDDIVASPQYGADTMRLYEMFMGPFDQAIPWDTKSIVGVRRFLEKVWRLYGNLDLAAKSSDVAESALHVLIKKISSDIEAMQFNTAIAAMMEYCNDLGRVYDLTPAAAETFLKLLHPFAPFIAEELWSRLGHAESISREAWPVYDENKIIKTEVEYAVQVNGKVRATVTLPVDADEATVIAAAKEQANVAKYLEGQTIKKTVFVPGRIVGFVV